MKPWDALKSRMRIAPPPARDETFQTLERPPEPLPRRVKTGRTEQFNVRVKAGFKKRVELLAADNKETLGGMLEEMLKAFESGASKPSRDVPVAEARASRTRQLRLWANDAVFEAVGKVAAERRLSVSALFEDLLAHEVLRLDPQGTRFGVFSSNEKDSEDNSFGMPPCSTIKTTKKDFARRSRRSTAFSSTSATPRRKPHSASASTTRR